MVTIQTIRQKSQFKMGVHKNSNWSNYLTAQVIILFFFFLEGSDGNKNSILINEMVNRAIMKWVFKKTGSKINI